MSVSPNIIVKPWFQFTLPRGERLILRFSCIVLSSFQFTLPRGERPRRCLRYNQTASFNSRSREGSDSS